MKVEDMWRNYKLINPNAEKYETWAFGGSNQNELLALILDGTKTATSSSHEVYHDNAVMFPQLEAYHLYQEDLDFKPKLPKVNEYNIILNADGEAECITRTTKVQVLPFNEVSSSHAYKEGEGDRTLSYWTEVHKAFFEVELKETGLEFSPFMLVVCEEFELVYAK